MNGPRRGVSLIETLVLMTAFATILSLSVALVCRAIRLTGATRDIHTAEHDAWRLSADLRRAARAASEVRLAGQTVTLIEPDGREHDFRFTEEGVTSELRRGGQPPAREAYSLLGKPAWEIQLDRSTRLLEIEARYPSETNRARFGSTALNLVLRTPRTPSTDEAAP